MQKALLHPFQVVARTVLSHGVDDDGASGDIIARIDPPELLKRGIGVWFIARDIVEMIEGHREVLLPAPSRHIRTECPDLKAGLWELVSRSEPSSSRDLRIPGQEVAPL